MPLTRLIARPRIIWRDIIMWVSDATIFLDELMAAYFFTDTAYQYTWSKLDVHETLMKDKVRVKAFQCAITETVKEGDRVLDLGTGCGILALLAAKVGAEHVVGVDSASIIDIAKKTAQKNNITNVEFIRADIRDLYIPKVDCIICELIGMQITDEGIIYKLDKARPLLKKDGVVIPEKIDVYLVPVESTEAGLGFWRTIYDIDYSRVEKAPKEPRNYDMGKAKFLSQPKRMFTINLQVKENKQLKFTDEFNMETDGQFHGCVVYFEAKLSENVTLSTDPKKPLTHWKHLFLPNQSRLTVKKGQTLKANVKTTLKNTKWVWDYSLN